MNKELIVPIFAYRRFTAARTHVARTEQILARILKEDRITWKLTDLQVQMIFDFFTSARAIQKVAFGVIKKKDHLGQVMTMPKVIRLHNKTDLVTLCIAHFNELGVKAPSPTTLYHYLAEAFPAGSAKMMRGINPQ